MSFIPFASQNFSSMQNVKMHALAFSEGNSLALKQEKSLLEQIKRTKLSQEGIPNNGLGRRVNAHLELSNQTGFGHSIRTEFSHFNFVSASILI